MPPSSRDEIRASIRNFFASKNIEEGQGVLGNVYRSYTISWPTSQREGFSVELEALVTEGYIDKPQPDFYRVVKWW